MDVEVAVTRPLWEPRHEWEARVKFVEDNVDQHGLEKAVNLSLVWANMTYLGCHYPAGTEALVSHYPEPSQQELRARRKCKDSMAAAKHEKTSSEPKFAEVSALLTSIHTQSSIRATHPQMQTIANKMCLCKDCLGLPENASYSKKGVKVLELLKNKDSNFKYELQNNSSSQSTESWSLVINGETVLKGNSSEMLALEDFVKMLNNWQEANQKPACPHVTSEQHQATTDYHDGANTSYGGQGSSYSHNPQQDRGYGGRGGAHRQEGRSYGGGGGRQDYGRQEGRGYGQQDSGYGDRGYHGRQEGGYACGGRGYGGRQDGGYGGRQGGYGGGGGYGSTGGTPRGRHSGGGGGGGGYSQGRY